MPEFSYEEQDPARETRAGAWILLFVGVAAFGFGIYHWRQSILDSFQVNASYQTPEQIEQARIEGLKSKDTDGDSLSDYDESYVFHTSPYLADSDSDSVNDKQELAAGTNPNCPEGKSCGPLGGNATSNASASTSADVSQAADPAAVIQQFMHPTAAQVRQFLIDSGAKAEDVQKIDDATLLQLYQQSLQEAQTQASQNSTP